MTPRARYGVDGYPYIVGLLGGGAILIAVGIMLTRVWSTKAGIALIALGAIALVPGFLGLRYVVGGKLRHRDHMLDLVTWHGDEQVLDIGTGGGLMLIGAAKRTPQGRAIGVDVWDQTDLSGNVRERAIANANLEGVAERIEVRNDDARSLSLGDATIDVVLATLCIHNIVERQEAALSEIARVLKPGGVAIISDLADTDKYVAHFNAAGFQVTRSGAMLGTFPFQRVVVARKSYAPKS